MRIVVSGYYGYGNAGDEWVLAGMLAELRRVDPALHVTVLSGDPAATERDHGVDAVPRMSLRAVGRALRSSDGLLSGGGSMLQDVSSVRPVAYYVGIMRLASLLGRRYAIYAQGLGPIRHALNRAIAGHGLRGAAYVSLRDEASVTLARRLGVRGPIDLVPDPALGLRPRRIAGPRPVVVAVRSWPSSHDHIGQLRTALATVAASMPVVALPMQEPADRPASIEVLAGIPGATVVPPEATLDDRQAAIGSASVVVGMRLHALVLAAAAGVPAVAVSYDPKVDAFAARVGQPVAGAVDVGIDPDRLVRLIEEQLAAPSDAYHARVSSLREDLRRTAAAAVDALRGERVAS